MSTNSVNNSNDILSSLTQKRRQAKDQESEENWNIIKDQLKSIGKVRQNIKQIFVDCEEVYTRFDDMNLNHELLRGIYAYGLEKPSVIQQRAIVPCIKGKDIVAQAQSGTGKTAAFVISILQLIDTSLDECQALILAPTRELAQQTHKTVLALGKYMGIESRVCIGGTSVREDVLLLQMDVQIVVGTVGRISDLIKRKALRLDLIKILVLDESDQLLDFNVFFSGRTYRGFTEEVFEIIESLDPSCQLFLSSATMPTEIKKISKWVMRSPVHILVKNEELTLEGIQQFYVLTINETNKLDLFCDLYESLSKRQSFVYCNTRKLVDKLYEQLLLKNIVVANIHGTMDQSKREEILQGFRFGTHRVLLTSDLLGRGIDVQQVSLVVNYDFPRDRETYIHRVGRSGRFGRKGIAITFITNREMESLQELQKFYSTNIDELPTDLSKLM